MLLISGLIATTLLNVDVHRIFHPPISDLPTYYRLFAAVWSEGTSLEPITAHADTGAKRGLENDRARFAQNWKNGDQANA